MDLRAHIRCLLLRSTREFATHPFWIPFAFDMHQRKLVSQRTNVRIKRSSHGRVAGNIATVTSEQLHELLTAYDRGEPIQRGTGVNALMEACSWVTGGLVGSDQSRAISRKEIKAMFVGIGT